MFARVARVASVSAIKSTCQRAPLAALAVRGGVNGSVMAFRPRAAAMMSFSRANSTLVELLEREIEEEKGNCFEGEELEDLVANVTEFFELKETSGKMEIELVSKAAEDYDVRVKFDTQDVVDLEEDYVEDDEEPAQSEDDEEGEEEDELPGIRFVTDVKRGNEGLQFECLASSHLTIERVRFLKDFSADVDEEDLYFGPNFIDLEPDLQEQFYRFLANVHVNDELAQFITQFADLKEQREYLTFLENAADFLKK